MQKNITIASYTYDETNKMISSTNKGGEMSGYINSCLGVRVGCELIMQDNAHSYTGFDCRWVYGLDKLSVKITSEGTNWWGQNVKQDILKDYYHQDRLGSTTNLTDQFSRVVGRADYNEWGQITYKEALSITSSYRRIWPQLSYTGHDWDDVLGMYYAKARFYSADDKRFVAMDPVKGNITNPLSLVPYVYCVDNPLRWVDPLELVGGRPDLAQQMINDRDNSSVQVFDDISVIGRARIPKEAIDRAKI